MGSPFRIRQILKPRTNVFEPPYLKAANKFIRASHYTNTDVKITIRDLFQEIYTSEFENLISFMYLDTTDKITGVPSFSDKWNQMKWNAINPVDSDAAYRQTVINTPVLSATGIIFNAGTNWTKTHCKPSTDTICDLNNVALGVLTNDNNNQDYFVEMGVIDGASKGEVVCVRYTAGANVLYANDVGAFYSDSGTLAKSFCANIRTTSTEVRQYQNEILIQTRALVSSGLPTAEIYRGGYNSNDIDMLGGSARSQCHAFRARFTDVQLLAYKAMIMRYQGGIESALGLAAGSRKIY